MVEQLERSLSRFVPESDVSRINRHAGAFVAVDEHTARLARRSQVASFVTNGAFDPLVGLTTSRWRSLAKRGADGCEPMSPPSGGVAVDGDRVRIPVGTALDFGGIAKGYAADLAVDACLAAGATRALVSLGTSSICVGPGDARPATVGVSSPYEDIQGVLGELQLAGSLSVSGRYSIAAGAAKATSHIIDPKTMTPCVSDVASVAVIGPDGATAEAFSTALVVLGVREALELGLRENLQLVLFTVDGRVFASPQIASGFRMRPGVPEQLRERARPHA